VTAENPRLLELRRRVQEDPASIAFAQLAEEYRRQGRTHEAVDVCRAGLAHHPDYRSARVTLGRALAELGRLDEAHAELSSVLDDAPDNLTARRALAEVYQQRGQLTDALAHYRMALDLARHDPEIEDAVERIESAVAPSPSPTPAKVEPPAVEDLFDFDRLIEQLGVGTQPAAFPTTPQPPVTRAPSAVETVQLRDDDGDPFSVLERHLRVSEEQRAQEEREGQESQRRLQEQLHEQQVVHQLEGWLAAIIFNRTQQPRR
jgi:tetratricopeptide (TPR) repeat protein